MKTPKALSERFFRSGSEMATKATTCRRLAGGLANLEVDALDLSAQEIQVLDKARALLGAIAQTYVQAAKLKKAAETAAQKRREAVRVAMKDNFDALVGTADKIAAIASVKGYVFDRDGLRLNDRSDALYLIGEYFRSSLDDIGYGIASASAADLKDLAPAAAVAVVWQRFQDRRAQLQDKFAQVIVRVDRLLATQPIAEPLQ